VQTLGGILSLVGGIVFPLAMVFWLNGRLRRKPPMRPAQAGLLLALNFVLPVALIVSGLVLLSPPLAAVELVRTGRMAAWLATAVIFVALVGLWLPGRVQQGQGTHGR
jgi:hypothetical protein